MPCLESSRPGIGLRFEDFAASEVLPRERTPKVRQMRPLSFSAMPTNTARPHIHPHFLATETFWTRPLRNAASSLGSFASIYVRVAQFWTTIAGRRPASAITV